MRRADLIRTDRSERLHIKAGAIQPHLWYHEMYAGTLCGRWVRVHDVVPRVPLDGLDGLDDPVCDTCVGKSRRFLR